MDAEPATDGESAVSMCLVAAFFFNPDVIFGKSSNLRQGHRQLPALRGGFGFSAFAAGFSRAARHRA